MTPHAMCRHMVEAGAQRWREREGQSEWWGVMVERFTPPLYSPGNQYVWSAAAWLDLTPFQPTYLDESITTAARLHSLLQSQTVDFLHLDQSYGRTDGLETTPVTMAFLVF